MATTIDELLNLLERALAQPESLPERVDAFVRAYWSASETLGEDWLPWGSPLNDAVHELGHDLQDYQAPGDGEYEPTLLHDEDALGRIASTLALADRPDRSASRGDV